MGITHSWEKRQGDGVTVVTFRLGEIAGAEAQRLVVRLQVHGNVVYVDTYARVPQRLENAPARLLNGVKPQTDDVKVPG